MSGPLRILLVTHYYPAHRGGVERIAGQLAERLAAEGVAEIEWHASDSDPAPASPPTTPAAAWNFAERRLGFPYPLWSVTALRRLRRAARAADVVHLHDSLYLPNLVAYAAARAAGTPVVVTQHVGLVPYRNPVLRAAMSAANRTIAARVLRGASRVVFESASVEAYFRRFVRFERAPLLIPNGVDTSVFVPAHDRSALRAPLGVPEGKPLFLFIGRFVEKKGLPMLRELVARLPHVHWLFAGWGPLDPSTWGRANVTVVRQPAPESLASLYGAADLLVLPSVGEGFPLAIQEAMACGTPALVGEETAAGCPEAGELLLREPVPGIERWLERLRALAGRDRLAALRPRVAAFAREHWSWQRCTVRYAEVLRESVANQR